MNKKKLSVPSIDTLLFFGSFDPFTIGHVRVIEEAISHLHSQKVLVVPAWRAVWGKKLTLFEQRVAMIELSLKSVSWNVEVSCTTFEKDQKLTGRTLQSLNCYLGSHQDQKVGILMGSDSLATFAKWDHWQVIANKAPIFVVLRNDQTKKELEHRVSPQLQTFLGDRIFILETTQEDERRFASSTKVREHLQVHGQTEYVLPKVMDYIRIQGLYGVRV